MTILAKPMGALVYLVYNALSFLDTKYISAYAIAIIVSTILLKLVLLPLTLKQTNSMKSMQDINPKIKELQTKYKNDKETLSRKTMELYKEHNVNPMAGCLPLLIQFPVLIGFFYVLREPVLYMFKDQATFDAINKSFLWISDLGFASNHVFETGLVNGLSMGGLTIPMVGAALPILAAISGITTYLTTKMTQTSQVAGSDQAASTQKTMTMMMPIMIFVFSLQFPAGLALYWVIGNIFQLTQQMIVLKGPVKPQED